jgi:hypothetical protein
MFRGHVRIALAAGQLVFRPSLFDSLCVHMADTDSKIPCEECEPEHIQSEDVHTSSAAPDKEIPAEDVMNPATFVKPDLKSEVHVVIEYCNRW